jgi:hypothetical protein
MLTYLTSELWAPPTGKLQAEELSGTEALRGTGNPQVPESAMAWSMSQSNRCFSNGKNVI